MLVQHRADRLRLIDQHVHALLSGELALAWCGTGGTEKLSLPLILAAALHDLSWLELDRAPLLDPRSGQPHDFASYPTGERAGHIERAIEEIDRLSPRASRLVALHYDRLGITSASGGNLAPAPGDLEGDGEMRTELDYLRLFDNLSLFICLTGPGAEVNSRHPWLQSRTLTTLPQGGGFLALEWRDAGTLAVRPYPFRLTPLLLDFPCRDLPGTSFATSAELARAWEEAPISHSRVRLE